MNEATKSKGNSLLRRLGTVGFLFFLAKGIAWLVVAGATVTTVVKN
jgi:hypothetical protein